MYGGLGWGLFYMRNKVKMFFKTCLTIDYMGTKHVTLAVVFLFFLFSFGAIFSFVILFFLHLQALLVVAIVVVPSDLLP
jgi:hypothetical protein